MKPRAQQQPYKKQKSALSVTSVNIPQGMETEGLRAQSLYHSKLNGYNVRLISPGSLLQNAEIEAIGYGLDFVNLQYGMHSAER